jgi:hypothetical protein
MKDPSLTHTPERGRDAIESAVLYALETGMTPDEIRAEVEHVIEASDD